MIRQLLRVLPALIPFSALAQTTDYLDYHKRVVQAEEYIVTRQFSKSLDIYRELATRYDYLFLRDCKVAAQLAAYVNDAENMFYFLERGMKRGWRLNEIRKNEHLRKFKDDSRWRALKDNRDKFEKEFYKSTDLGLRAEVRKMFIRDQKRALRVALTPVKKWRERYTSHRFVPNNRAQVRRINQIIDEIGYPGERIIGDKSWATVIISHNEHDTIYKELRPKLYRAFGRGEIAAIDLAIIETWRVAIDANWQDRGFMIWKGEVTPAEAAHADSLRSTIGLRSIELNNELIAAEKELKMNFYLSPFLGGIITMKDQVK